MGMLKVAIPAERVNLVTNPSFETGTTGWTAYGSGVTLSRTSSFQRRGTYCLQINTASGIMSGARFSLNLTGGTQYTASADVLDDPGFSYWFYFADNFGTPVGTATVWSGNGKWKRKSVSYTPPSTGTYRVYIVRDSASSTDPFEVDGVQVEAGEETTYFDGDTVDCRWTGTPHASTSIRPGYSRAGGRLVDFEDLGLRVIELQGVGMPGVDSYVQDIGQLPGALAEGEKVLPRSFSIIGEIVASSLSDLHSKRKSIIDVLKSDRTKGYQPITLCYFGADSDKPVKIRAHYAGGMEASIRSGFNERVALKFLAADPYWYEDGERGAQLSTLQNVPANRIIKRTDGVWSAVSGPSGWMIHAIAKLPNGHYILGGEFASPYGHIAEYDPDTDTLSGLGSGTNHLVEALAVAPNGDLYAAGYFTIAGGVTVNCVAKWDGSAWSALGSGVGAFSPALAIAPNGDLYVGGSFTTAGGVAANRVAKWDGSAWSALGSGVSGTVYALAVAPNGDLYVGGTFTAAGGVTANRIARWDGSSWSALGSGMDGTVYALAVAPNGDVYAGGYFTTAGGVTVNKIAKWDGSSWSALGGGMDDTVYALAVAPNGDLYASGTFTTAGGLSLADRLAVWNGSTWAHVPVNLPGASWVPALHIDDNDLYVSFDVTGTAYSSYLNTVSVPATTAVYPKIKIKRTGGTRATVAYLKNETTGATIWLNYDLADGETLTLDFGITGRSVTSDYRGNVIGAAVLRNSDFASFNLLPGENRLSVYVIQSGSPTVTCDLSYQIAHWSLDGSAP